MIRFSLSLKALIAFCFLILPSVVYSQDGLDTNSFDTPATQNGNSGANGVAPSGASDQTQDAEMNDADGRIDQNQSDEDSGSAPSDPQNLDSSGNENAEDSAPAEPFDEGANPSEMQETPEGLSLNPATDALKQEYYPSFIYDDRGRKDPFEPVIQNVEKVISEEIVNVEQDQKILEGLSKYEVSALKVSAILIGKGKPKALVRDPSGVVYVIHENDIVGRNNGVVKKIRSSQIVIVEARDQKDGDRLYTTQVLSVAK